ncbi:hypothetical protein MGALJ_42340 [Mycobacterium gallinarum]|uniref:Uncharacterized protein n=1 Tax=Mycobacterium gallinarum TaxID=39689 RepID=A0A9W4BB90_9MYCO|nr:MULTISPECIES: hypothetical protein [Mycobacterium]MDV3134273.1 cytochrome P450 [Mycobacterium sp. 29Ha]BBY94565.1 hypothetical protein MGALJ_42340 [Mycobacterium gallinarum]
MPSGAGLFPLPIGLISDLLAIPEPDRQRFAKIGIVIGFETAVNLNGNAVSVMLDEHDPWRQLVADPGLAEDSVEETLRSNWASRFVTI